jgi:catechol 2,3-dioxygenase-like lactoylglutathione lyase family enzyme
MPPLIVPELLCTDLNATKAFYIDPLGFSVTYERPEETFAYLTREGVDLMFEQVDGPGRRWLTGRLERPFGRGINLQIEARDVAGLFARVSAARPGSVYLPLEEKAYRCGTVWRANRQFLVQDPDGYLLRFAESTDPSPDE